MSKKSLAIQIVRKLHESGHEAYLAGGCVRDEIRGVEPKDYDVATSARPDEVQKLFSRTVPVGAHFGVVLVVLENIPFEVATFRSDSDYKNGRHPSKVSFTSVEEDAKRRDFTVNGLYFDIRENRVLDFVEGQTDLTRKIIRTIGSPEDRFLEDHLRLLRAIRFAVQLDFQIEHETLQAVSRNAEKIRTVSQERIRDELTKTFTSVKPGRGLRLLDETGLLAYILPEAVKLKGVKQPLSFHPEGDVYTHTLIMMDLLQSPSIELAMGALLHDIAKPQTYVEAPDRIRFHGHESLGAEMAEQILRRLTFSNEQIELIVALVAQHLRFKDAPKMRLSTLKRFLSMPRFDLHLELHRLDCVSSHGDLSAYEFCRSKLEEFSREAPPPARLIGGDDLIRLGLSPGPEFSRILREVEDLVLEGKIHAREEALEHVKKHFTPKRASGRSHK